MEAFEGLDWFGLVVAAFSRHDFNNELLGLRRNERNPKPPVWALRDTIYVETTNLV